MQQNKRIFTLLLICLIILLCACSERNQQNETTQAGSTEGTSTEGTSTEGTSSEGTSSGESFTAPSTAASVSPPAAGQSESEADAPVSASPFSGELVISFNYVGQSGSASNQFAVWIE
ncbi:MAG: hypothetical protein FWH49_07780, partial [Clostridiales bacterium]|nr:hypothetical protein [Clostridiales bacterium]